MKDLSIKKLYYSISEVSKITDLEQYVLRYWETEFEELKPQKNRAGNRIYTNRDIKLILYIKKLLREERYTIEGAKQILKSYNPDADGEQLKILDKPEVKTNNTVKETNIVSTEVKQGNVKLTEDVKSVLLEIKSMLEEIRDKL
ncbi:MAG TPA: MerR family transcriptional regulator [Ignavibacteria bacterium]